ncbi:hypothetical protein SAMN03080615_03364 [Amphritea atlantica]|uniref:Uncharacterized protein n=1 Tax=Amphritea atlantica TaxID=355243 RepID=A0A1H9K7J8_9GAMM|nr:hypothetical protein [Amphritea atlantica]SEQ95196.1 hypothetical protein SAMN03080615_03364 [Amphritea atlantica]
MKPDQKVAFVVEESINPSSDFFVIPELKRRGYEIRRFGFDSCPAAGDAGKSIVVFVRYVPRCWKLFIDRHREHFDQIIYFMDDDLLNPAALSGLPLRYRFKLVRYAFLARNWLQNHNACFWVSTPYLQSVYSAFEPVLVAPVPLPEKPGPLTIFYHGSSSHNAEIRWLVPVIEEVLRLRENTVFEVIGNTEVRKWLKGLSRVNVLQPMNWSSYQALILRGGRDIGLAPLLDSPFNRARSHTKYFDITAAGAAGVFADDPVYTSYIEHESNGMTIAMDKSEWVCAIVDLIDNKAKRIALHSEAKSHCFRLGQT